MKLCRDRMCIIKDDLEDLWSDMERDMLAYCSPLMDPSPPPPRNVAELSWHIVLRSTIWDPVRYSFELESFLKELFESYRFYNIGYINCAVWLPLVRNVTYDCTIRVHTKYPDSICQQMVSILNAYELLSIEIGPSSILSMKVACKAFIEKHPSRKNRPIYQPRASPKNTLSPGTVSIWNAATFAALFLCATSIGFLLIFTTTKTRRSPPFRLRVERRSKFAASSSLETKKLGLHNGKSSVRPGTRRDLPH